MIHERKKPFECEHCGYSFGSRIHLEVHIGAIHEGKKPYQCDICDKRFSRKHHLSTHTASVHEGKKPFECVHCGHSFFDKKDLRRHVESLHEGKRPFKCEICQQAKFGKNCELKMHISRVHDNPKRCSICNLDFSKRNLLRNHVASVHEDKILFKCEICKMEFATKKYLSRHISYVHTDNKKLKEMGHDERKDNPSCVCLPALRPLDARLCQATRR